MSVARFVLRLPAALHRTLVARAAAHDVSLNAYCVRKLAGPEPLTIRQPAAIAVRERAAEVAGRKLGGILVHGSWARAEVRAGSDLDVLVVVDATLPLTRALYRAWDSKPLEWEGRPVDAHFVHLPADPDRAAGIWCEAAIDGVLIDDRDGRVDATLRRIRRAIADGRLLRKHAHGQPYWTAA